VDTICGMFLVDFILKVHRRLITQRAVEPHYRRADDEGHTLIQSALMSAADIEVTEKELRVTLSPLSSPHRTQAIAALCEELNQTATMFPGSRLCLRFAVKADA